MPLTLIFSNNIACSWLAFCVVIWLNGTYATITDEVVACWKYVCVVLNATQETAQTRIPSRSEEKYVFF